MLKIHNLLILLKLIVLNLTQLIIQVEDLRLKSLYLLLL